VGIAREEGIAGIIATNTTISREGLRTPAARVEALGAGGISGAPVRARARQVVSHIWRSTGGTMPIVGVGGIFTADDAWEMIRAGASLVQLYTGFIYQGPRVAREICLGVRERMRHEGFASLHQAVGSAHG
jgi:dihydroorotate dehydrogenase